MANRTLFDSSKDSVISGVYYKVDNGYINTLSSTSATFLLRVAPGDVLTYNGILIDTNNLAVYFDSNFNYLSGETKTSYTLNVPENVCYVGFNIQNNQSITITCESTDDSYLSEYYCSGLKLYDSSEDSNKTADSYINGKTGEIISNSGTSVSSSIDLNNVKYIQFINGYTNVNAGVFFDQEEQRISNISGISNGVLVVPVPETATSLKCTIRSDAPLMLIAYYDNGQIPKPSYGTLLSAGIYISSEKISYNKMSLSSVLDYILGKVN